MFVHGVRFSVVINLLCTLRGIGVVMNADVLNDDLDVNCQRSTSENPTIKLKICDKVLVKRKFSYFLNFGMARKAPFRLLKFCGGSIMYKF